LLIKVRTTEKKFYCWILFQAKAYPDIRIVFNGAAMEISNVNSLASEIRNRKAGVVEFRSIVKLYMYNKMNVKNNLS